MYTRLKHELTRRARFVVRNDDVDFLTRLRIASAVRPGCAAIRYMLDHRLVDEPDGTQCFRIAGHSLRFDVPYQVKDRRRLLQGIGQVLVESFIFPELFSSKVFVRPGDVVLDLGANIGTTALLFSSLVGPKGKVFAFEPVVHELCQNNLTRNRAGNVTLVPQGVSDKAEDIDFGITDFCLDSSILPPAGPSTVLEQRRCPVVRLDDWVTENDIDRVDFIKMDIEGAEEKAIRGALSLIERFRPRWSISSYHIDHENQPQHAKLVALLRDLGYSVEQLGRQHIFAW